MDFDEEIREYVLDLNGEPYEGLFYLANDFDPSDKKFKVIEVDVDINGKNVLSGFQEW